MRAYRVVTTTVSGDIRHRGSDVASLTLTLGPCIDFPHVLSSSRSSLLPGIFPTELPTHEPLGEPQAKTLGLKVAPESKPQDDILELSLAEDSCLCVAQRCWSTLSQSCLTPPVCSLWPHGRVGLPISHVNPVSLPAPYALWPRVQSHAKAGPACPPLVHSITVHTARGYSCRVWQWLQGSLGEQRMPGSRGTSPASISPSLSIFIFRC